MSPPIDVLVLAATGFEARTVSSRMKNLQNKEADHLADPFPHWVGSFANWKSAIVVQTGIGDARARSASAWAMKTFAPRRIFVLGVSGGLSPQLAVGQILLATEVKSVLKRHRQTCGPLHDPGVKLDKALKKHRFQFARGAILSSDEPVMSVEEKGILFAATGAIAVDLESHAFCSTAAEFQIPICVMRTIIDDSQTNLPDAIMDLVTPEGESESISTVLSKALGSFSLMKGLLGMPGRYIKAQDALSQITTAIAALSSEA